MILSASVQTILCRSFIPQNTRNKQKALPPMDFGGKAFFFHRRFFVSSVLYVPFVPADSNNMQKSDLRGPLHFVVQQFCADGVEEIVHIVFRA